MVAPYTGLHLVHQGMKMEHLVEEFDCQWRYAPAWETPRILGYCITHQTA